MQMQAGVERIEINGFAGVKYISVEVKKVNILIGPQASGKSIVAKLLFYFKSFISSITAMALDTVEQRDLEENAKEKFKTYFPISSWGTESFSIRYLMREQFIEIQRERESSEIVFNYSDFYKEEFNRLCTTIVKHKHQAVADENYIASDFFRYNGMDEIRQEFLKRVESKINKTSIFSQIYVPAGRSFFANLKSSIFSLLSNNNALDPFLIAGGAYYERMRTSAGVEGLFQETSQSNSSLENEIRKLNRQILCGRYFQKKGEDYLRLDGGREIRVQNSSSGQQETLPLAIILGTIAFLTPKIGGNTIYIEEPEAHIFPAAQRDIIELIAMVYKARQDSIQFLITTHSPYVLTAFNNLLQAGSLAFDASEEVLEKISEYVSPLKFIEPNEIAVYSLENGNANSIFNDETELIDTNIIDGVSNELAIQFDQLLDIDA